MEYVKRNYEFLCRRPSDINEHLPTLFAYTTDCESVVELGVRGCVSSWAFLYGLLNNNKFTIPNPPPPENDPNRIFHNILGIRDT